MVEGNVLRLGMRRAIGYEYEFLKEGMLTIGVHKLLGNLNVDKIL